MVSHFLSLDLNQNDKYSKGEFSQFFFFKTSEIQIFIDIWNAIWKNVIHRVQKPAGAMISEIAPSILRN